MTTDDPQPIRFVPALPQSRVQYDKRRDDAAYGKAHRELRARLLRQLPTPCIRCGRIIPAGIDPKLVHLDHYTTPARNGGLAGEGALAHRRCNEQDGAAFTNSRRRRPGQEVESNIRTDTGAEMRNDESRNAPMNVERDPHSFVGTPESPALPAHFPGRSHEIRMLPAEIERAVLDLPWIAILGPRPDDERLPRIMSGPHPRAVYSWVQEWEQFCTVELMWRPYWWQKLVASRILEFDIDGQLVWLSAFLSTTRQVGKSALLRSLALFRVRRPDLFGGEPQTVFLASTTLAQAMQVMRPGLIWADSADGWRGYRGVGYTRIEALDNGRWLIGTPGSSHSFTINLPMTDEAWGIDQTTVEDHLEPTMLAADCPQFLITSTAHPEATMFVPNVRARAIDELLEPEDRLIIEWSVDKAFSDVYDERLWRVAAPRWSVQRQRLLRSKTGSADFSPVSFRAQYLNQWLDREELNMRVKLADPTLFARCQGEGVTGFGAPVVVAVEDWFGQEGSVAVAEVRNGSIHVSGETFKTRTAAWDYVDWFVRAFDSSELRVLVGASLLSDPRIESLPVSVESRGFRETRTAIGLYRSLLRDRILIHDAEATDLTAQILGTRLASSSTTGARLDMHAQRNDLTVAALWAIQEAATAFGMVIDE